MVKVSIVLPVYNREKSIGRSIGSIVGQTFKEWELLVIDDGSEDGTEAEVRKIEDERIRYIRLPENGGAAHARNEGVRFSSGEIIAFQDSDDSWRPDRLKRQLDYWEEHPAYSLIYSAYLYHRTNGQTIKVPADNMQGGLEGENFSSLLLRNSVGTPTILVKRDCFLEAGGFDTGLRSLEDWEFALRFSEKYRIGYLPEILVDAYETEGGISSNTGAYYESRCRMIGKYREDLIRLGLFDQAVGDVFHRAEQSGVLDHVRKLLMLCLKQL